MVVQSISAEIFSTWEVDLLVTFWCSAWPMKTKTIGSVFLWKYFTLTDYLFWFLFTIQNVHISDRLDIQFFIAYSVMNFLMIVRGNGQTHAKCKSQNAWIKGPLCSVSSVCITSRIVMDGIKIPTDSFYVRLLFCSFIRFSSAVRSYRQNCVIVKILGVGCSFWSLLLFLLMYLVLLLLILGCVFFLNEPVWGTC